MLYSLSGTVACVRDDFFVLETAGIGFRVRGTHAVLGEALERLRQDKPLKVFCYWQPEQGDVYGFLRQEDLSLFEFLISVSGIGPKMGIKLLNGTTAEQLASLILFEKRDDLSKISGISAKTASKIIIELKEKLRKSPFGESSEQPKSFELEELLRMLGYPRADIEEACSAIDTSAGKIEEHLKQALRYLSSKKIRNAS